MKKLIATGFLTLGVLLFLAQPAFSQLAVRTRAYSYPYSYGYSYPSAYYPYYYPSYSYTYPRTYSYSYYPRTYGYSYYPPTYSYAPAYTAPYTAAPVPYTAAYPPTYTAPSLATTIGAYDNYFRPGNFQVAVGTQVRWVNYGRHTHTVTANDGSWDSGDMLPGAVFVKTFDRPGTYYFYCRHHTQGGMRGAIVVGATGSNAGAPRY